MDSKLDPYIGISFQLLQQLADRMGWLAWLLVGVLLATGILIGVVILRWILGGGLGPGASRRFFIERW